MATRSDTLAGRADTLKQGDASRLNNSRRQQKQIADTLHARQGASGQ